MKKLILLSSLLCFTICLFAQDIIVTKDNERIEAKVLKTYDAVIKYALFSDPNGETFLMAKSKIVTILYEDGVVETFENAGANTAQQNAIANNKTVAADNEKIFKNVIKLKPLSTIISAFSGILDINLQYTRYLTPKVGIPLELDFATAYGMTGFNAMTGVEAVPATHRQKSGLLINVLAGILVVDDVGLAVNINIGYQLVTKKGFVFATTIGPRYNTIENKISPRISIDFGFAF
jgi:hypothetical protein